MNTNQPSRNADTVPASPAPQGQLGIFVQEDHFSGPLPDPNTLQGYERIVPGAAQTIIEMAKLEQAHRHKLEDSSNDCIIQDVIASRAEKKRGQWMAFSFALVALMLGAWLISVGQTLAGSIFAGGCVVGIVSSFLKNDSKSTDKPLPPTEQGRL